MNSLHEQRASKPTVMKPLAKKEIAKTVRDVLDE
jgi:hypothetical protein